MAENIPYKIFPKRSVNFSEIFLPVSFLFTVTDCRTLQNITAIGPQPLTIFAKTLLHTHHDWEWQRLLTEKYLNIFWRRNGFKHVLASTLSNNSLFYFVSSSIEYFEDFSIKRWLNSTQWKTCIHYESTMETTSSLITTGIISHLAYNKISPQKMILRGMNPLISQVIPYFSFHLISSPLTASRNYLFTQYGVPERRHHNIFVL